MIRWIKRYLFEDSGLDMAGAAASWVMTCTGFFFMLPASEYLNQEGRTVSEQRVLSGLDLMPRTCNTDAARYAGAEELVAYVKGAP